MSVGYTKDLIWKSGILIALCLLAAIVVSGYSRFNSMAEEGGASRTILYDSVRIQPGDSLWDIAAAYHGQMDMTMEEYVEALRQTNGLKQDTIHAGRYLTILYSR